MFKKIIINFLFILAAVAGTQANAASVSLLPSTTMVVEGGSFMVDVVLDASDTNGNSGSFLGAPIITWESGLAAVTDISAVSPATLGSIFSTAGSETIEFANAPKVASVIRITFDVLGSAGSTINLGVADSDGFGSFLYLEPTIQQFTPEDFTGSTVTITAVPIPATVWLITGGLGLFGFVARRWQD
jgi:hypothetical protein